MTEGEQRGETIMRRYVNVFAALALYCLVILISCVLLTIF